jgi:hypothetical protein
LEYAFGVSAPTIVSIANDIFNFDDLDPSTEDKKDCCSSMHVMSHHSTPLAQATKRAGTGPTPARIFVEDKKGEENIEMELESEDPMTTSLHFGRPHLCSILHLRE